MVSENERRDWIEVGVHATLSRVYSAVSVIMVLNSVALLAIIFFSTSTAITAFVAGIATGLFLLTLVLPCMVKADKISREWAW